MILVDKICKMRGKELILDSFSFQVEKGDILGIIGPNGAGKSTLLSVMSGMMKATSGHISYDSEKKIAYVPQDIVLFEELSVIKNMFFFASGRYFPNKELVNKSKKILTMLNINEYANKRVSKLSGGIKRRLNIAVALIDNPNYIFLDESIVGIDEASKLQIIDTLKLMSSQGKTIILTSHIKKFIDEISTKILLIENGKIGYFGDNSEKYYDGL